MVCIHGQLARSCEICEAMNDHAAACEQNNRLRAQLAESHAEIAEQARLLSMSAEREVRLLAKIAECERELAHVKLMDAETLRACQRWIAEFNRLEAAIRGAPHADDCSSHNAPRGREVNQFGKLVEWEQFNECDCWKHAALEDK